MKKYCITICFTLLLLVNHCLGQDTWQQLASFPSETFIQPAAFSINSKIYFIGLQDKSTQVWEYDPATNVWIRKANVTFEAKYGAVAFNIGNKGYYGMGSNTGSGYSKQFYEYDPVTDSWTKKADYPMGVSNSVAFSILNKGYVCSGNADPNTAEPTRFFAEYDPQLDKWASKASFPDAVSSGSGFVVNNKAYVGMGVFAGNLSNSLYEYNPGLDKWSEKASLHSDAQYAEDGRYNAITFSVGDQGYIGLGTSTTKLSDFWRYDVQLDTWGVRQNAVLI